MRNPLKDEEAAFRFVLGAIVFLAPVVLASWIATWLGLVVFAVLSVAAVAFWRGGRTRPAPAQPAGRARVEDTPDGDAPQ